MGGRGAQRYVFSVNEPKKTGARSARARSAAKTHYSHHIYVRIKDHVLSAACALCSPVRDSVRRFFHVHCACSHVRDSVRRFFFWGFLVPSLNSNMRILTTIRNENPTLRFFQRRKRQSVNKKFTS
jgi:hypothetical protein